MSRLRTEYAAEAFLLQMRKEWVKRHPGKDCPIQTLEHYSGEDRSALLNALGVAVASAQPARDKEFDAWVLRREERLRDASSF